MDHTSRWSVDVFLFQHDSSTTARAVLRASGSLEVVGTGSARSVTRDPRTPEIVDEVAVGRALQDLGGKLTAVAVDDSQALIGARDPVRTDTR